VKRPRGVNSRRARRDRASERAGRTRAGRTRAWVFRASPVVRARRVERTRARVRDRKEIIGINDRARGRRRDARDDDDGVHRPGDDDDVDGVFVGDVLAVRAVLARGGSSRGRRASVGASRARHRVRVLRNRGRGDRGGGQRGVDGRDADGYGERRGERRARGGGDAFGDVGFERGG